MNASDAVDPVIRVTATTDQSRAPTGGHVTSSGQSPDKNCANVCLCLFTATNYHFWEFYVTVSIDWCLFDGQNFVRVI